MYREKIRDHYDHLSRSYRRVADYVLSNYYDVSFMTAAQLAELVDVDTTTVVRFSQRIGYNGYPELLGEIREQVRSEIYSAYKPKAIGQDHQTTVFKARAEQERQNLSQMLIHNPQEHISKIVGMLAKAGHIVILAEGYAESIAEMTAQQLRHSGFSAESVPSDPILRAGTLIRIDSTTLVIGVSATEYGREVAKAMAYARSRGCATLGIVGSMDSSINRMSDQVIYAPTSLAGPLSSVVAITAALAGLLAAASVERESLANQQENFDAAYQFLVSTEGDVPEEDSGE